MRIMNTARQALLVVVACCAAMSASAGPVNVNTATAEQLAAELEGVGITKARAIVAHRNANGHFTSARSLTAVTGIGDKTVALNAANILLEDSDAETK